MWVGLGSGSAVPDLLPLLLPARTHHRVVVAKEVNDLLSACEPINRSRSSWRLHLSDPDAIGERMSSGRSS
jgi:hypothetical protein